jgi:hypothetical protein
LRHFKVATAAAAGPDDLSAEIIKHYGEPLINVITLPINQSINQLTK